MANEPSHERRVFIFFPYGFKERRCSVQHAEQSSFRVRRCAKRSQRLLFLPIIDELDTPTRRLRGRVLSARRALFHKSGHYSRMIAAL